MPLRSGKEYLAPHMCLKCNEFYSHEIFNNFCSGCSETEPNGPSNIGTPGLDEWVKQQTVNESNPHMVALVNAAVRFSDDKLCMVLCLLKKKGYLLHSKDAIKILGSSGGNLRGHIVAAHVADWWNIKCGSKGEWPDYLACYYGDFNSSSLPRKLPPRAPNSMLHVTGMNKYLFIQKHIEENDDAMTHIF